MSQCQKHATKQSCSCRPTTCVESLEEMDFRRGIWSAARDGDVERIEKLAERGVDLKDSAGYTALHYASRSGSLETCLKLLQLGANPNALTNAGNATPLHRAVSAGHIEIVKLLLKYKSDPTIQDADGQTPLHRATAIKNHDISELLLKESPQMVKVSDKRSRTPSDLLKELNVNGDHSKLLELLETTYYNLT